MPRKAKKPAERHTVGFILCFALVMILVSLFLYFEFKRASVPCANDGSCTTSLHLKIENNAVGTFDGQKVLPPPVMPDLPPQKVLGTATVSGEKHIYVDLSTQTLWAYQGSTLFMKTFISSGKTNPTPDGTFTIWEKIRATRMTGGLGADYYDLPNVPYVMFFQNSQIPGTLGYSLHGTYWHNNFGHPMSHGCINMRIEDVKELYYWSDPAINGYSGLSTAADPGTKITIYGKAPI